jgi:hypothetical protein
VFTGKPDLLFVEFAVNDSDSDSKLILRSMEGIVRKTWKAFPACDICFVYTLKDDFVMELGAGKFNRSAAIMETVAGTYAIPTIHLGLEVVKLAKEGKLQMKAPEAKVERVSGEDHNKGVKIPVNADGKIPFSKDGVHPYIDTGHQIYTDALIRSLPGIIAASKATGPHELPPPMDPNNSENSSTLAFDKATLIGPWTKIPNTQGLAKDFSNRVDFVWKGEPGATLSFQFKGTGAMVYDLIGPDCGSLELIVDGEIRRVNRIDGYCTYNRLALLNIAEGLDPLRVHEVTVKVLPDKLDKEKILFVHNRKEFADNPRKYEPLYWYASAIFLV